jgi:DNA-binding transcriptional LysR family regulator
LLPPFLRRFRSRHPATELVVVTGNAPEITRAVVENDLDVGIVSLPVRDRELSITPFFDDELVAIAAPHPRWRRRTIGAEELAREPLILYEAGGTVRRVIDGWFRHAGAAPVRPMELGNTEAIKKLVEAGLGLSVTSWFSVKADVRARLLVAIRLQPALVRKIGVVRRRDKPSTPALAAFHEGLEQLRASLSR